MKYETKAQKICNEIRAYLIRNDTEITPSVNLKLNLLESTLIDYLNSNEILQREGYIMTFNKGTSIGVNPIAKLKNDTLKLIIKIVNDLVKKDDGTENTEEFIKSLIS